MKVLHNPNSFANRNLQTNSSAYNQKNEDLNEDKRLECEKSARNKVTVMARGKVAVP
jgi:hypothetical protein